MLSACPRRVVPLTTRFSCRRRPLVQTMFLTYRSGDVFRARCFFFFGGMRSKERLARLSRAHESEKAEFRWSRRSLHGRVNHHPLDRDRRATGGRAFQAIGDPGAPPGKNFDLIPRERRPAALAEAFLVGRSPKMKNVAFTHDCELLCSGKDKRLGFHKGEHKPVANPAAIG